MEGVWPYLIVFLFQTFLKLGSLRKIFPQNTMKAINHYQQLHARNYR